MYRLVRRLRRIVFVGWFAVIANCASWQCDQAVAGPFAPPAGQAGSTAIDKNSLLVQAWASGVASLTRGPKSIANPAGGLAAFGNPINALGAAQGTATDVVSLGDGGQITLSFDRAITDGVGADFAVFENGFADAFLELALIEVSSNGLDFVRFPDVSLTQTATQVSGFDALDATNLDNLAGKYHAGFGTPFDLSRVAGLSPLVDVTRIQFVRVVDVVGAIDPLYRTLDSLGNPINDPWPTPFDSGGFDLDAVGVLHQLPDANGDNRVDFSDLGILLNHFDLPGTFADGDFDVSGAVDFADLGLLLNTFQSAIVIESRTLAVPEPGGLLLLFFGASIAVAARCQHGADYLLAD